MRTEPQRETCRKLISERSEGRCGACSAPAPPRGLGKWALVYKCACHPKDAWHEPRLATAQHPGSRLDVTTSGEECPKPPPPPAGLVADLYAEWRLLEKVDAVVRPIVVKSGGRELDCAYIFKKHGTGRLAGASVGMLRDAARRVTAELGERAGGAAGGGDSSDDGSESSTSSGGSSSGSGSSGSTSSSSSSREPRKKKPRPEAVARAGPAAAAVGAASFCPKACACKPQCAASSRSATCAATHVLKMHRPLLRKVLDGTKRIDVRGQPVVASAADPI
eukprot:gene9332-3378_t